MTTAVKANDHLLYSVLNENNKKQVLAILNTLDNKQVLLLTEIFFNLLRIPQSEQTLKLIKRHKVLINKLSNSKVKPSIRVKLIKRHSQIIYKIIFSVRKKLLQLLK